MKIELSSIIENQLPTYVREEYPLAVEFLKQYYLSDNGNRIVKNLETYLDIDTFFDIEDTTTITQNVDYYDDVIYVASTKGFPDKYGLFKIDDEIITYTSKTDTSFEGCVRGFSGVDEANQNKLVFTQTTASQHTLGSAVDNLSVLFLKTFFLKIKQKIAPGFQNRDFYENLNQSNFLKKIQNFYSSKGTPESFRLLFGALYGKEVEVILPRDRLFSASNAEYRITKKLVVEAIEGDPRELKNNTLYQDSDGFIPPAIGTVTYVEKITRNNKDYYIISLDFDYNRDIDVTGTVKSDFVIHPKTIISNKIPSGATYIDVDSTVGFPNEGKLVVRLKTGEDLTIPYTSKTFNQFLGCTNIINEIDVHTDIRYDSFAYGYNPNQNIIKLRITGVLSDPRFVQETYLYKTNDKLDIQTLGYPSKDFKANDWVFNIPLSYNIETIELVDSQNFYYQIKTIDNNILFIGDDATLISGNIKIPGNIVNILDKKSFVLSLPGTIDTGLSYIIKKELTKVKFQDKPELEIYNANIQNTFVDADKNVYVLSSSLPSYLNVELTTNTNTISVQTTGSLTNEIIFTDFQGEPLQHPFYTGDSIVYKPLNETSPILLGVYFVKKVNENTIKLATSRQNIVQQRYLEFSGTLTGDTLEFFNLTNENLTSKEIQPQNIIRKLEPPTPTDKKTETNIGAIGILNNGTELLNYKSSNLIFYGPIQKVISSSHGDGYDIINPPTLTVIDTVGTGATVYPHVKGQLERIDLIDSGFDYYDEPTITIKGGNGKNAIAKANLIEFTHSEFFNAAAGINTITNVIGFTTYHKFRNGEQVTYISNNQTLIGGLISNEKYFAHVKSATEITLHNIATDAIIGINSVNIVSIGVGIQEIQAINKKKKVNSVFVINPGNDYQNRKNFISGISTFTNTIEVKDHKFSDGEIVYYTSLDTPSEGLVNNTEYIVKVIDSDNVRLSEVSQTGNKDSFYTQGKFINITSFSSSRQYLSYPPISVEIKGRVGVTTFENEDYNAKVIPVFRGGVIDVTLENGGQSYGSEEVIDFNNQPTFIISRGSGSQLKPIISNGKIVNVIVQSSGNGYISYPDLVVTGDGYNAVLTPIIENGSIKEVKIISSGFNYTQDKTKIEVRASGSGAKFEAKIKSWRINLVERFNNIKYFSDDDGIIQPSLNPNSGLQYYHLYVARLLRSQSFTKTLVNGALRYVPDLVLQNNIESNSVNHSPIIGWAYDGNPIYGPYGYTNRFGSSNVKQLTSGYEKKDTNKLISENRPSETIFPIGFFVEDYEYRGNSDLDEHNGRYCVTPEFPNGTYAYFASFEPNVPINEKYKQPKFPYVIGATYYSKPIAFNLDQNSTQKYLDLNSLNILRNITPYNLRSNNTQYDAIIFPSRYKKELLNVKSVSTGDINQVTPITAGDYYKVNDKVSIQNNNSAIVSKVTGKSITSIASSITKIENVEFITTSDSIVGYSSQPHDIQNNELVKITTYDAKSINEKVVINPNVLTLSVGMASTGITGIVTYLSVYGNISDDVIRENDVYQISDEKVKILNIDRINSRLRVIRSVGMTSYTAGIGITEVSRKLIVPNKVGINQKQYNKELYFIPKETVAIGLSNSGVTTNLYFSNPGIGPTSITVVPGSLYLPDHKLQTNDQLIYNSYGNNRLSISTNGITTSLLASESSVYVIRIDSDFIGISTNLVGIGSTGNIIGVGTATNRLYFSDAGNGEYQSFKTNYNTLNGDVIKQDIIVSTASSHKLSIDDQIDFEFTSGITTTIKIQYDDINRRLISKESTIVGIDTVNDILSFSYHNFKDGEQVIYKQDATEIGGLANNQIYFVIKLNEYKIKLASSYYNSTIELSPINLSSNGDGKIYSVNPELEIIKNSRVVFDLSDSSLAYNRGGFLNPAFTFNLYTDKTFNNLYFNNSKTSTSNIASTGIVGVTSTANLSLILDNDTPSILYYNLVAIPDVDVPLSKSGIVIDTNQVNNNKITIKSSSLNGKKQIKQKDNESFTFSISELITPYNSIQIGISSYTTNSKSADGGIKELKITKNNSNNSYLPEVTNVKTSDGVGAVVRTSSDKIGIIKEIVSNDIGFEYSCDFTLNPKLNLPRIIKTESLFTVGSINVLTTGTNYYTKPNLVLIDDYYQKPVLGLGLEYLPDQKIVNVTKNVQNIRGTRPYIIPTNNTSGIAISSISYNQNTKNVTVVLDAAFSFIEDFPFNNGDKVLIENVIVDENEKGYNSAIYDYRLFEVENIDPNIGGIGASFSYSMEGIIGDNEVLGTYDGSTLQGTVVPQKYFPTFEVNLAKQQFIQGENVFSDNSFGTLEDQNLENDYIKVLSNDEFTVGKTLVGQSSKTSVIIKDIIEFEAYMNIKSSARVVEGWKKETGFFNNDLQRLHDNDYYQYFSYSLKSEVDYSKWNEVVSDLNHPAGFKKFSDLIVPSESPSSQDVGFTTSGITELTQVNIIDTTVNMNCYDNFDLVRENSFYVDGNINSNEIYFENTLLQDYIESVSNRVLKIDDEIVTFTSEDIIPDNVIIDTVPTDRFYYKRYFISLIDKWDQNNTSNILVNALQNGTVATLNQYAEVRSGKNLGNFDVDINQGEFNLRFYPEDYQYSSYYINSFAYQIGRQQLGVTTLGIGTISQIQYIGKSHSTGIGTTTIVGFSSSIRAAKLLIGFAYDDDSHYEVDEVTIIHDGTNILFNNYGELQLFTIGSGIGTYNAYYSNNQINIDLIPNDVGFGTTTYRSNIILQIIQNSTVTGIGSTVIGNNYINSSEASSSGIATELFRYTNKYNGSYSIIVIENTSNPKYEILELVTNYTSETNQVSYVTYGNVYTDDNLGIVSSYTSGNNVIVEFNPFDSDNYTIRSLNNIIFPYQPDNRYNLSESFDATTNFDFFDASLVGANKNFELYHNGLRIFRRYFDGSSYASIGTTSNTIRIPNHYFVTGEEVTYSFGNGSPIGIATTTIGLASTDKLPETLYIVKVNDLDIQVAAAASDALAPAPRTLDFTQLGIGSQHSITSKYQKGRTLLVADNIIQSPIHYGSVKTSAVNEVGIYTSKIFFNNIEQFEPGDIFQIDNEVIKVLSIGVGSTNGILVDRAKLGTNIAIHTSGSQIRKINGNFNIIDNTVYYENVPYQSNDPYKYSYTFTGRVFMRSGLVNSQDSTYSKNYVLDDISQEFDGITKKFVLTQDDSNVTDFANSNAIVLINNVFQYPQFDYTLSEIAGISSITFTGAATSFSYDVNNASIPRGGIILSVGSTQGFGYQPLVSAGGTAVVSIAGTIHSISIGNSGSGYRNPLQIVRVGVQTESTDRTAIEFIGTAIVTNGSVVGVSITNPGIGYTIPPNVIFDSPLPYSNLPLIYRSGNIGVGTQANASIVIGQGSSVINFELNNSGYGYKVGEKLTLANNANVGILTDASKSLTPFEVTVDRVFHDNFASWIVGDLQAFDPIDSLFNGVRRSFQLKVSNSPVAIIKKPGANIDLKYTLLIFINDILQIPEESYSFEGGSIITFNEPPTAGDTSKIIFYRGTSDYDTLFVDVLEDVKPGDNVTINSDILSYQQSSRIITDILTPDTVQTYLYPGPGISENEDLKRPATLCKQTEDIVINGQIVSKNRVIYEPIINPTTKLISSVSTASTQIFVENVRAFFDNTDEYLLADKTNKSVKIISTDESLTNYEEIKDIVYDGDFGIITGIKTAVIGVASTALVFDFYIPNNSILKTDNYVINTSGITTGYYFSVTNSNIGNGIISLNNDESPIGVGSTFIDNVYRVYSVSIGQTSVPGIGITDIVSVTVKVDRHIVGTGFSAYYGDFSWGRLHSFTRTKPKNFTIQPTGITTSPIVQRIKPLKYDNYYN